MLCIELDAPLRRLSVGHFPATLSDCPPPDRSERKSHPPFFLSLNRNLYIHLSFPLVRVHIAHTILNETSKKRRDLHFRPSIRTFTKLPFFHNIIRALTIKIKARRGRALERKNFFFFADGLIRTRRQTTINSPQKKSRKKMGRLSSSEVAAAREEKANLISCKDRNLYGGAEARIHFS